MGERLPHWPRVQRAKIAASYSGYGTERDFRTAVACGEMPPPFTHDGADAWDIADIDAAVDTIKAGGKLTANWREGASNYAANRRVAGRGSQTR
ncbi:hypothetical protein [Sphingomonas albertensis]|uniref:Uncharacterized protein n=1 Tax=Sphingomonas albertensis TaxID=2762591 RepID=A0ABR7ASA2_9SPHN|nr:hypothetical protein [Sphingomonas albertensis]MBC3943345.1 hypothetical protein [Sphingomonas albertensis]